MPRTRTALKASFWKLLETRPLRELTVKEIVQDCGVNRNSFYYHFKDLPSLVQEVLSDHFQSLLTAQGDTPSLPALLDAVAQEAMAHRQQLLHLSQSAHWEDFAVQLLGLCRQVVETYAQAVYRNAGLSDGDREVLLRFYQCACFGQVVAWLSEGAKGDLRGQLQRLCQLGNGVPDLMVHRAQEAD